MNALLLWKSDFKTILKLGFHQFRLFVTPRTIAHQASLSVTNSRSLLKLMSIESVMPCILCRPLLLLPSIFPSIRIFSNELVLCIRWPKYWSFSFSINPSNEYSFRMDWLDLLAVQGDSQESSPTSQSKSINNSVHSFLLEKEMATHSSTLAWKIPRLGEPGRLQSMGSQRVRHDWMTSLSFFL